MAVKYLFNITLPSGHTYDVKYDIDAQTPFADSNVSGDDIDLTVPVSAMGSNQGQTFYTECSGTTLIKVIGRNIYPFAFVTRINESPSCGFTSGNGGPCAFTKNILVVNETFTGEKDGSVTLNVFLPADQPVLYSLNNLNFQTNRVFSNLGPGTYNWYAKSLAGPCKTNGTFVVAAGAVRQEITFPWQDKYCHLFQLIRNGITYKLADEPIKWDAVNIKGKRDPDFHGWKDQYSDEIIELEFDCVAGRDVLEAEYDLNGSDGVVRFQYGISYKGQDYIFFDGKINFNTFKAYPQKVSASVESMKYNPLLEARLETKVAMNSSLSVDGLAITPPTILKFPLHSKAISQSFILDDTNKIDLPATELSTATRSFILPEMGAASATELENSYPTQLSNSVDAPYDSVAYQFKMSFGGVYVFNIAYGLTLTQRLNMRTGTMTVRNYFMINDNKQQVGDAVVVPTAAGPFIITPINYNYTATLTLAAGDEVYFFTQVDFVLEGRNSTPFLTSTKYQLDISQTSIHVSVGGLEQAPGSTCNGWFLFDAINHVVKCITNEENYIKSSFLGLQNAQQSSDGGGALFVTTNGKQVRNFDVVKNPLVIDAKTLLSSAKALFCLGYGFENIAGTEVMRIERVDYFYRNQEILVIDDCTELHTDVAKELLFNEYQIGYEKYQEDGNNSLDEFNTYQQGTTPIKTNKQKLVQQSKLIGSGYALEFSRRQQFSETPTSSFANDDEAFIIAMRRIFAGGVIYDTFQPERNEPFASVNNVLSPSTAYNLRISPGRMLRNWGVWLRPSFHYKSDVEKIRPTQVIQNGELTTQFLPTEPRPVGDLNREVIKENRAFDLTELPVEERLYRPEWISFKTSLTPDKIQLINKCMKGAGPANKNYGYIAVKDEKGLYQAGFIYELDYNFSTEVATIKMLKKYGNPVTPGEECCNYLVINGCRILVNGRKITL